MIEMTPALTGTIKLALAGFFGVMVRMMKNPSSDWKHWLIEVVTGIACCVYLTPFIVDIARHFTAVSDRTELGVGFLIGYTGLTVAAIVQKRFLRYLGDNDAK